ncbi:hypothetical protein FQN50_004886 [Emmonsiellopsis sp. PD_5]|nr:hypothetical protein FQN50_004886 [Emmonsiellopsis sp. PD_5]
MPLRPEWLSAPAPDGQRGSRDQTTRRVRCIKKLQAQHGISCTLVIIKVIHIPELIDNANRTTTPYRSMYNTLWSPLFR